MTAAVLPQIVTETTRCVLCFGDASRTLGEICVDGQLLGRMVQCVKCSLRYLSPRPSQAQRDWLYAQEYDHDLPGKDAGTRFAAVHGDQDRSLTRFARYLRELEPVRRRVDRPRLLDVGAGTGQLMALAKELGWEVFAVEPSEEACQFLRRQFGAASVLGRNIRELRSAAGQFDGVVMAHVIEHLADPLADLQFVRRLLAPGGQLVIATPNDASLYERLWYLRQRRRRGGAASLYVMIRWKNGCWHRTPARGDAGGLIEFQILTTEHLYFFTRATLGRLARRAGFPRVRWASGSVARANSPLGRLLRNDLVNRGLFLLRSQAELVAVAGPEAAMQA